MINIGDKVIFMENEHWEYSEEVVIERPKKLILIRRINNIRPDNIWFRNTNGDESQLSHSAFIRHVRCGDIIIRPRPIKPIQYIEKHNFVG